LPCRGSSTFCRRRAWPRAPSARRRRPPCPSSARRRRGPSCRTRTPCWRGCPWRSSTSTACLRPYPCFRRCPPFRPCPPLPPLPVGPLAELPPPPPAVVVELPAVPVEPPPLPEEDAPALPALPPAAGLSEPQPSASVSVSHPKYEADRSSMAGDDTRTQSRA